MSITIFDVYVLTVRARNPLRLARELTQVIPHGGRSRPNGSAAKDGEACGKATK
jgi:hypothetical protein